MLKKLLIGAVLTLLLAACASTPATPGAAKAAVASTQPPAGCVGSTGLLAPANPQQCAVFGTVYTRDDMDRVGAVSAAGALRLLDPTLTVR